MNKRFKESSEQRSDENTTTGNILSKLSVQDLKGIKVAIRRHDVLEPITPAVVHRNLEDPKDLIIYRRRGEGQHPIFDRRGIVVNVEERLEERIVLKSPENRSSRRSRSETFSDREHSVESYRSRSSRNRRSYSRSPSATSRKDAERKSGYPKDYGRSGSKNSTTKGKQKSEDKREEYRDKRHPEETSLKKESVRSGSPNYKRNETDRYELKNHASSKERYRDKSPKAGPSKNSRESPKERDNDGYRKDRFKASPKRTDYRDSSPKRFERNRSRSRSPKKAFKHSGNDKEKYARTRVSPPYTKRYSVSPHGRKRSRSPYSRKRTPSPPPHFKKTSPREERGFSGSSANRSKIRRRSGSPYERERDYPSSSGQHAGHSRPTYSKRRSRSPHSRRHSRSPHRTELAHKFRRRSRSPFRRDSDAHHRVRSRSPSNKQRKHSEERSYETLSSNKHEYPGMSADFGYYGAGAFWIPGPIPRPGFIPRGVIPPPIAMARGMMRPGPSYVIPRPYIPMPHHFRPRFPASYNRPYRPRMNTPSATITSVDVATTNALVKTTSSSTTSISNVVAGSSSNPIVVEPENSDSAEVTGESK